MRATHHFVAAYRGSEFWRQGQMALRNKSSPIERIFRLLFNTLACKTMLV